MKKQTGIQIRNTNRAILAASRALRRCNQTCRANGSEIRNITFRVLDGNITKLHVTFKRPRTRRSLKPLP